MKDIISKFNLYDHFGYILVGFYCIMSVYVLTLFIDSSLQNNVSSILQFNNSIILVLVSYLLGHIIQAVSNLFGRKETQRKEEKNNLAFVLDKAKRFFDLPENLSTRNIFNYCYLYAQTKDTTGQISLFNSMYSLYRGLFITSVINLVSSLAIWFYYVFVYLFLRKEISLPYKLLLFIFTSLVLAWLFEKRKDRFFNYFVRKY